MRYDADQKTRTHKLILAEAASAIRTKGPERMVVAEVMNKLGLTHGGFYAHFASKDRLTEGLEPQQALQAYIDWYLSAVHRDAPGGGCPLAAVSGDLPRLAEAARLRYSEGVERLAARVAKLLKALGTKSAEALALSAVSEMAGAMTLARAVADPARSNQILRNSREIVKARLNVA
jgi:TetR/AcrR family transcriptional repressor of nem operon